MPPDRSSTTCGCFSWRDSSSLPPEPGRRRPEAPVLSGSRPAAFSGLRAENEEQWKVTPEPNEPEGRPSGHRRLLVAVLVTFVALWVADRPFESAELPTGATSADAGPVQAAAATSADAPGPAAGNDGEIIGISRIPVAKSRVAKAANGSRSEDASGLRWEPKTFSVVLPCAGEGEFAKRTVDSILTSLSDDEGALAEIVLVDDGSDPPVSDYINVSHPEWHKVSITRHSETLGLIRSKVSGARAATGDILIFFDCHVAPQPGWHKEFLKTGAENYRRIMVPMITDLDIDTWTESTRGMPEASKCYLTWDGDFKWYDSATAHMPVLSGGLLGISRRWWDETGGYDESMGIWGGENIDQSLRTWLCGGEMVSLPKARVAHMWRTPEDKRTEAKYKMDIARTITNRARAVVGWMGDFAGKLDEYPDMRSLADPSQLDPEVYSEVRKRLKCKPFAWYLWRFRDIYEEAGLVPASTFQLRHRVSDMCLTFGGPPGAHPQGRDSVSLRPCGELVETDRWSGGNPHAQRWHSANKDPDDSGRCCSGLRAWNTDQCLMERGPLVASGICSVGGGNAAQWFRLTDGSEGDDIAAGQLLASERGLCLIKKKDGVQLALSKCKRRLKKGKEAKPTWMRAEVQTPLEAELYQRAKLEQPELFVD